MKNGPFIALAGILCALVSGIRGDDLGLVSARALFAMIGCAVALKVLDWLKTEGEMD